MAIDLLAEAKKRPFAEKLQLVQDLWDAISEEAMRQPLSEAQVRLLDERIAEHDANPNAGRPADEVLEEIRRSLSTDR
jgi:putative addiction module component (TIGR02574 family)